MPASARLRPRDWLRPLRYVPLLLVLSGIVAIAQLFVVRSNDMAPALQEGDLALVLPMPEWLFGPLRRGDLVLVPPGHLSEATLRRVVALPGEVVEIVAGQILIEGLPLEGKRTGQVIYTIGGMPRRFHRRTETLGRGDAAVRYEVIEQEAWHLPDRPGIQLGPDQYYVLADRRTGARDSRDYGPLPGSALRRVHVVSFIPGYALLLK
ncbi:MAG: signal peptidase I [Myxococcales bacterium]|nr:signal peptidase I [Myxococcota bacterium]MDW8281846.1 signal peptidase I [Myxococcales bacterium]